MPNQQHLPPGTFGMAVSRIWRDTGCRGVLQHPVVAADLLRLACAQAGIADLDPQTLRRESERQIGPELAQAENDVIWSSPDAWPGAACTYFHIEVQSTVERNMALRMLRYVTLHSFRLWSDHGPPMPVVVPIVFYTGDDPWDASLETGALYAAAPAAYRLLLRCEVVDLCRLEVPEGSENLIELLAPVWRGESATEVVRGARALYEQLAALGNKPMEESFLDLVLARCERKWPEENWKDCASMAELVKAMEQTWPQKWRARYVAEGIEVGRAQGNAILASLETAVRTRFGEAAARSFGQQLEIVRQAATVEDLKVLDAMCQCVMQSENAEQLMVGLKSIRTETA